MFPRPELSRHPQRVRAYGADTTWLARRLATPERIPSDEAGWLVYLAAAGWSGLPLQTVLDRVAREANPPALAVWADWHLLRWAGDPARTQSRLVHWEARWTHPPMFLDPAAAALAYLDRWALARLQAALGRPGSTPAPPTISHPLWSELTRWAYQGPPRDRPERILSLTRPRHGPDPYPLFVSLALHHRAWDVAHVLAHRAIRVAPGSWVPLLLEGILGLAPNGVEGELAWYLGEPPPMGVRDLAFGSVRVHLHLVSESGAGAQVQVEAKTPLYLEMITSTHHFAAAVTPGRHTYTLSVLDRTDWIDEDLG